MISRIKVPGRPAGRLKTPLRLVGKLVPVLKAYSGIRGTNHDTKSLATLGRLGTLEVRLARTAAEIRRAQKLRYDVFYREMSAVADAALYFARRDIDLFDAVCDHLLVIDEGDESKPTAGFQRVVQRTVIQIQGLGRDTVTGAELVANIFAERESHAAFFLQEQEMTSYDAVNYINHGIAGRGRGAAG